MKVSWFCLVALAISGAGCANFSNVGTAKVSGVDTDIPIQTSVNESVAQRAETFYQVLAAEIAGRNGMLDEAGEYYANATALSNDPDLFEQSVQLSLYIGNNEQATRTIDRWLELSPDSDNVNQLAALVYMRIGDIEKAQQTLTQWIDRYPDSLSRMLASVYKLYEVEKDHAESVLKVVSVLPSTYPQESIAHRVVGQLALEFGANDLGLKSAADAYELNPQDLFGVSVLARAYLQLGDEDSALSLLAKEHAANPDNERIHLLYANALLDTFQEDAAKKEFKALADANPENPLYRYNLGLIQLQSGEQSAARANFDKLTTLDNYRDSAYFFIGRSYMQEKEYTSAINAFKRVERGDNYIDAQTQIGLALAEQGKTDEMQLHFKRLIEKASTTDERVEMYLAHGRLLSELDRSRDAFDLYTEALGANQNNSQLLYARAMVAEGLGEVGVMEQDFKAVLAITPDDAVTLNALGYTLADLTTRYDEAEQYILKAIELNPDDPATIDSLGWLRFKQERYVEAETHLRKAFAQLKDAEIASHLVQTLLKLNRANDAKEVLDTGLKASPESELLLELEKSLTK